MKVLIVDDDREDAEFLFDAVKEFAAVSDCRIAHSGAQAKAILNDFIPDVIFLDAIMYPIHGQDVLSEFAKESRLRHTRFIVITGAIMPDQQLEFIAMGATAVVQKPSNYNFLKEIVQTALSPNVVNIRAKILTDDTIVHDQTSAIRDLLSREMQFDIELNSRVIKANIQFMVSEAELTKLASELDYRMLFLQGGHWLPKV